VLGVQAGFVRGGDSALDARAAAAHLVTRAGIDGPAVPRRVHPREQPVPARPPPTARPRVQRDHARAGGDPAGSRRPARRVAAPRRPFRPLCCPELSWLPAS
jgi:hypothetical protein